MAGRGCVVGAPAEARDPEQPQEHELEVLEMDASADAGHEEAPAATAWAQAVPPSDEGVKRRERRLVERDVPGLPELGMPYRQ